MVVEDAHWADGATLDLIAYLGGRLTRHPALLVLTLRDDEVMADHPLHAVLEGCAGHWSAGCRCRPCPPMPSRGWPAAPAATLTGCTRPPAATRCWSPRCWPPPSFSAANRPRSGVGPAGRVYAHRPGRSPRWSRWSPLRPSRTCSTVIHGCRAGVPGSGGAGAGGQCGGVPARVAGSGGARPSHCPRCTGRAARGRTGPAHARAGAWTPVGAPRPPRGRSGGRAALGTRSGPTGQPGGRAPATQRSTTPSHSPHAAGLPAPRRAELLEHVTQTAACLAGLAAQALDARQAALALREAEGDPLRIGENLRWVLPAVLVDRDALR